MQTLEKLREEINLIDTELKKLLDRRFDMSVEVGKAKAAQNLQILDGKRERAIYEAIKNDNSLKHKDEIVSVYSQIMKESKAIQKKISDAGREYGN